jgi:outer membrane protein OmpA-like peptidoglycan-associated protein/tetratricopeptide (TPR) repeat protein
MKKVIILSFLIWCFSPVFSQVLSRREFIKAVQAADILYYYNKEYEKAAGLYEPLLKVYPDNSNLAAKLGICYLNIDGKRADALKLLNKASANIVNNESEYDEYGEKAPSDTYLYLAIAYHKNDSIQKAISLYLDAKKRLGGTDIFQEEYIDNQIRDCRYALELLKKPLTITASLFAPWLIEYPGACNPVVSKNDSVFVFTQKTEGKTRILCSYKTDKWEKPTDITNSLGGFDRFYSNSITGNGKLLILFLDDGDDGNLYISEREDTTWTRIKSAGKYINTIYLESHGFITPDGKALFIASNRPGGEGGLDIWFSEKAEDGDWKRPVNCGDVINTPYDENTPFYDIENKTLLFSSQGHTGMGGYDVFRSVDRNGIWTNPVCMPYSFNNMEDNTFFILNNKAPGFITSYYNEKNNTRNIYSIVALDPADKTTIALGNVTLQDGMNLDPRKTKMLLSDLKNGVQIKNITVSDSASFRFQIKPGDYRLLTSYDGYKTDTVNLNLPLFYPGYISVNVNLVPDKVIEGDFLSLKNVLFESDSYNLNEESKSNLNALKSILLNNPELKIEVAGYTDVKGTTEYNYELADKRAQAVIDYLIISGISRSRLLKKVYGKSDYVVENSNPDGSDNPEGRKYNRRVTFGILDPQTGVLIRQEVYIPEHLRLSSSMAYSIVLIKSSENLGSSYFSGLKLNDIQLIRPVKTDSETLYVLSAFYSKNDASKYLDFAIKNGFKDAYIINNYEINMASKSSVSTKSESIPNTSDIAYTIQLMATKEKLNMNKFKGIDGVKEIASDDGLYRYISGQYSSFSKAKAALSAIQGSGFKDAFIRELNSVTNNK